MHKLKILKKLTKDRSIFYSEDGFSTLTVVVALLLSLTLIFSSAQVYRIQSASADIQNVSDACAQAAENQVAEFMILVRLADSASLSLSLGGIVVTGLGVVAMCTPVTFAVSDVLIDAGTKLFNARDKFADTASKSLNTMQKSLPFLASVKAYQIALANNGGLMQANYMSIAILMPGEGTEIKPGNIDSAKNALNDVKNQTADIKKAAQEAEEAAHAAQEAKLKAFNADCGNNPNYCMYERAKNKAYMTGSDNPLYSNVDNWSFSVALDRCKAYYPKRYQIEKPEGSSVNEQADSALRKVFYSYAAKQMQSAYVYEHEDDFDSNFPHLPKNTEEMKQTSIYTQVLFPVSDSNGEYCMHAYENCPGCSSVVCKQSISQMDYGSYKTCDFCKFKASSMGKVAAASSSIDNGYEYHYAVVENAAKSYKEAKDKAKPANAKVKGFADNILNKLKEIIKEVANKRIYAKPPGSYGCICLTVNTNSAPASTAFESSFVSSDATIGIRAAVSASTLVEEESTEGKDLINSLVDNISKDLPTFAGGLGLVLEAWSKLLSAYSNGQESFFGAIQNTLDQLPLISASGLGTWASNKMKEIMKTCGLEPANTKALKPVLINSMYIAKAESADKTDTTSIVKNFSVKYLSIQDNALKISDASNSLLSGISNGEELKKALNIQNAVSSNGKIEIACIQPLGDWGPSIPITITLPKCATDTVSNITSQICGGIQSVMKSSWGGRVWR